MKKTKYFGERALLCFKELKQTNKQTERHVGKGREASAITQMMFLMTEVMLVIEELTKIKTVVLKWLGNHPMVGR